MFLFYFDIHRDNQRKRRVGRPASLAKASVSVIKRLRVKEGLAASTRYVNRCNAADRLAGKPLRFGTLTAENISSAFDTEVSITIIKAFEDVHGSALLCEMCATSLLLRIFTSYFVSCAGKGQILFSESCA